MGFRGGNGPFGAHLPPRLRLGGKYGPLRPISHPQTMENREFTARIHCFTTITRTKYHFQIVLSLSIYLNPFLLNPNDQLLKQSTTFLS